MARVAITGFEVGDASELASLASGWSIVSGVGTYGNYAARCADTNASSSQTLLGGLNVNRVRFRVRAALNLISSVYWIPIIISDTAATFISWIEANVTSGSIVWKLINNDAATYVATYTDTHTYAAGEMINLAVDWTIGAGTGACTFYINGVQVWSITNGGFGSVNIGSIAAHTTGGATTGATWDCDDFAYDDAVVPGVGGVIARQFKSGTPNDNAFTKTSGTIDTVWNDTPFNATSNASSATSGAAQTALTASFATTQAGHGNGTIGAGAKLEAVKVGLIGKTSSTATAGGAASVRRRFAGGNTDTAITFTTADAYYQTAPFTATVVDLNASEAGLLHGANTRTQTIEDAWVIADYNPGVVGRLVMLPQARVRAAFW